MRITNVTGEQLEKDRSNSPEDSFARATVTYEVKGKEKTFSVLYPIFFQQRAIDEGLVGEETSIHEVIAMSFFEKYPDRKRVYISEEAEFLACLKETDTERLHAKLNELKTNGSYNY